MSNVDPKILEQMREAHHIAGLFGSPAQEYMKAQLADLVRRYLPDLLDAVDPTKINKSANHSHLLIHYMRELDDGRVPIPPTTVHDLLGWVIARYEQAYTDEDCLAHRLEAAEAKLVSLEKASKDMHGRAVDAESTSLPWSGTHAIGYIK